jgi:lysylphosphatidylglycerol synthetase-like protein (DUF2156 family)
MKEALAIMLILVIYVGFSYLVRKLLLSARLPLFILICVAYVVLSFYLFDLITYEHQNLRLKGIYFEFGHAELLLLGVYGVCLIIALLNIIAVLMKKYRRKKNISET